MASEAADTWKLGKKLGLSCTKDDDFVTEKIEDLIHQDLRSRKRNSKKGQEREKKIHFKVSMIIVSYNIRGLGEREKKRDVKDLIKKVRTDMCCLQESKLEVVNQRIIKATWGNSSCDWDFVKSEGSSGGIISIWNPAIFRKVSSWSNK